MQVFPSKGKPKNNIVQVSFVGKMHAFFFFFLMYPVDSGHLHFTSKKIPVCGRDQGWPGNTGGGNSQR